ncbi:MAG: phage baseplate protein [Pyrinomonadaceae bacterium]
MRALSAPELLSVWEQGLTRSPIERALLLLAAACCGDDETPHDALVVAHLSVGERDARLLTLREWTFGPQLTSLAHCPSCGERLESSLAIADLRVEIEGDQTPAETLWLEINGYELHFRLPNSLDLLAVASSSSQAQAAAEDLDATRALLLARCLLSARYADDPRTVEQLPAEIVGAMIEKMSLADPQSDLRLAYCCPQCGAQWQAAFDIGAFFWSEIEAWAERLLREVHVLASRYGWREWDILCMTPQRRQFYLHLIGG